MRSPVSARVPEFRPWMRELLSEIRPTEHDVRYRPGRIEHTIWLTSGPYRLRIIIILFADALDIARHTHTSRIPCLYSG
jgi:hypothetical protein